MRRGASGSILLAMTAAALFAPAAHGSVGLSSQFVNVSLEGLEPGRSYELGQVLGRPYSNIRFSVRNGGKLPPAEPVPAAPPAVRPASLYIWTAYAPAVRTRDSWRDSSSPSPTPATDGLGRYRRKRCPGTEG